MCVGRTQTFTSCSLAARKAPCMTIYRKEIHGHGEQIFGCQEGGKVTGMGWQFEVNRCKLLHSEQISHEIPLYSTGNCI